MSYYAPFPGFYAYAPVDYGYAMYGGPEQMDPSGQMFYAPPPPPPGPMPNAGLGFRQVVDKPGYNNRKESNDSGIFDSSSRRVSSVSTASNVSADVIDDDVDDVDTPFVVPDDELCHQINQQVEFYFSDANICKDKFLLKHVKRNKEGYVSLKLISSFKRIKHLTKDWRQVAYAVEKMSKRLEVNDVKSKVRRIEQLPEHDETAISRTVLAINLPMERPTIESVAEIFSVCGDVALIRILRPGNPLPADVRPFAAKNADLTTNVCALIEYERTEFAIRARKTLTCEGENQLKVMELVAPPPSKASKKIEIQKKSIPNSRQQLMQQQQQQQQQQQLQQQSRRHSTGNMTNANSSSSSGANAPRRKIGVFGAPKFLPIAEEQTHARAESLNPKNNLNNSSAQQQQRKNSKSGAIPAESAEGGISAWMNRRISSGQLEATRSGLTLPPNVIRQPRGPEEGKGFQRARKISTSASPDKAAADQANDDGGGQDPATTSYESALANLTIAPVIVPGGSGDSCSSDDDDNDDEALEKSR